MLVHLRQYLLVLLSFASSTASANVADFQVSGFLELQASRDRGPEVWLNEGLGKLRYSKDDDGIQLSQGALSTEWHFTNDWHAEVVWHARDGLNRQIDPTEAYLTFKPLPIASTRYQLKLGAFYPSISLENTGPAWTNRYLVTNSAINTWIGEELRTIGLEASAKWLGKDFNSDHSWALFGALTTANDPAGTLLAWRGWALHDRQTSLTERLPLANLPAIQPGEVFELQPQWVEPFAEIDDKVGWYAGGSWSFQRRIKLTVTAYNNEADPTKTDADGQYAWRTDFRHVAVRFRVSKDLQIMSQWMKGYSLMGIPWLGTYPLAIKFNSNYALLSYRLRNLKSPLTETFSNARISLRYDHFEVIDMDETSNDNNQENGHAWFLAYLMKLNENLDLGIEYGRVDSDRMSRVYNGLKPNVIEKTFKLVSRWSF